jgi:hypothetical protein
LIEIISLVDIPANTDILVDYGADFFPKEMPAAVSEVMLSISVMEFNLCL